MDEEQLRRWVASRTAAADREWREWREAGPDPRSIEHGFELITFAAQLHGWPIALNDISRAENESVARHWRVLRERLLT